MKYIFLYKRLPDIDHLLPIAFGLTQYSKVNNSDIIFIHIMPDLTISNYKKDRRITFLNSLGIKNIIPKVFNLYILNNFLKKKNWFLKLILYPVIKILDLNINYFYFQNIKQILKSQKNFVKLFFANINYQLLFKIRKFKKNNTYQIYGVHVGLPLRNLYSSEIKNYEDNIEFLDFYLFPYCYSLENNSIFKKNKYKLIDTCPCRYDLVWIEKLKKIYQSDKFINNKKINIIFFLEKKVSSKNDNQTHIKLFEEKIITLLDFISNLPNTNLIIKAHPSLIGNKEDYIYLKKYYNIVYFKDTFTSFELINNSDIVLGVSTSALIDAFLLNKKVIIINYLRSFDEKERAKLIFDNFDINYSVDSFDSFKILLMNFFENKDNLYKEFNEEFKNLILKDINNNPMKLISRKITKF